MTGHADSPRPVVITDPSRPLVTVVTPSYNQGRFIRATIESVLTQDYPNIEYWVIDGASTDDTRSILLEYASDPRFHWLSEKDRGQGDAVNKGWRLARGEILGWLNSDDVYLPGAIAFQVDQLTRAAEVGVVYGDAVYTNESGEPVGTYHARPFDRERFLHLSAIPQPTAFMRRSLLDKCGGIDVELHYALDYEFYLRLMWETTFAYSKKPLATYRLHDASKTIDSFDAVLAEAIDVVQKICDKHAAELPPDAKAKAVSDWWWSGAMRSLEARAYRDAGKHALSALRTHPLRPRMATFCLSIFDAVFRTRLTERLVSMLDRRADPRT